MELSERTWLRNCCVIRAQEGGTVLTLLLLCERWNFATRRLHNSWERQSRVSSKQKTNVCVLLLLLWALHTVTVPRQDFLLASMFFIIIKPPVRNPLIAKKKKNLANNIYAVFRLDNHLVSRSSLCIHTHTYTALFRCLIIILVTYPIIYYKSSSTSSCRN